MDQGISELIAEFGRSMCRDPRPSTDLGALLRRGTDALAVSGSAVLASVAGSHEPTVAASDPSAWRLEDAQRSHTGGPGILARATGSTVVVPDLMADGRFGAFASTAQTEGVSGSVSVPLSDGGSAFGSLDLFFGHPGALNPLDLDVYDGIASLIAAYLVTASRSESMRRALLETFAETLQDPATGLAGRAAVMRRIETARRASRRTGRTPVVVLVDVLGPDPDLRVLGAHRYEAFIAAAAERIRQAVPGDVAGHLGCGRFVVAPDVRESDVVAADLVNAIRAAFEPPLTIDDEVVPLGVRIGVGTDMNAGGVDRLLSAAEEDLRRSG
ncbi:MAG: hypothetical protein RIE08_01785 [Acidimicrobiales bacterium]